MNSPLCATATSISPATSPAKTGPAEYRARVAGWNSRDEAHLFSRFNPDSPVNRLVDGAPHNRSFRLAQARPKGQALLIHCLT